MARWIDGFDPQTIILELSKASRVRNGKVSFSGLRFREHIAVLTSMLSLDKGIPAHEKMSLVQRAVFASARTKLDAESLRLHAMREVQLYLQVPPKRFKVAGTISIPRSFARRRFMVGGSGITVRSNFSRDIQLARDEISDRSWASSETGEKSSRFSTFVVEIDARSEQEAIDVGLERLDLLRGLLNFARNRRILTRESFGEREPLNRIVVGTMFSIHNNDGTLAKDAWWTDPTPATPPRSFMGVSQLSVTLHESRKLRVMLARCAYHRDLSSAIIRYCRAMDSVDWHYAFLQLWSVLEFLTGTGPRDNHSVTVKRTAMLFSDEAIVVQYLNHLRDYRNRAIHSGHQSHDPESLFMQLKRFVEHLLKFHLVRAGEFSSIAEAAEFMSQSSNAEELRARIRKLKKVLRFLESTSPV